MCRQKKVHTGV